MSKAVRNYILISLAANAVFLIGGLFLFFYDKTNLTRLCVILGCTCTLFGIMSLVVMRKTPYFTSFIPFTFTVFIFSAVFIIDQEDNLMFLPIFCFVWMCVFACFNMQVGVDLLSSSKRKLGLFIIIHSVLPIFYGILSVISYELSNISLLRQLGVCVIAYSINQLINYHFFYKNYQDFTKFLLNRLNSKE